MVWPARTDDGGENFVEGRGPTLKRRAFARAARPRVTPSQPHMLSWQQMASFNVHREEFHDLPQQRGTREK